MKWYKPGLGEVHNEDHSQMIYCEDADGIVDNELAERVCELLNSEAQTAVEPAVFSDEDYVLVPRGLLGAACYAIATKRNGTRTLAELHRYTTGDLSAPAPNALDAKTIAGALFDFLGYLTTLPAQGEKP